jgi:hypothetical protein
MVAASALGLRVTLPCVGDVGHLPLRSSGIPTPCLLPFSLCKVYPCCAWAERYEVGDVLRYSRASEETGIGNGEYAQVKSIDSPKNRLNVELQDGTERTYDPRRQQGVSVFREEMRNFSVGDRVQFTAPANNLRVAKRESGPLEGDEVEKRSEDD